MAAAFSANWDTVGIDVGGRTLKLSFVLFAIAAFLQLVDPGRKRMVFSRPVRRVNLLLAGLLAYLTVRALLVLTDPIGSAAGIAAILIPAVVPFASILMTRLRAERVLQAFLAGMVFSAALAVVEYGVRSLNRNWITDYSAAVGARPRSASLSFEAAYFAAPAFAALVICWFGLPKSKQRTIACLILVLGLVTADARIVIVQAVVVTVWVFVVRTRITGVKTLRIRGRALRAGMIIVAATLFFAALSPSSFSAAASRVTSIFDQNEQTSNAPRLSSFEQTSVVIAENALFGIGPAQLNAALGEESAAVEAVANNIWLQGLLDGGVVALLLQAWLVIAVIAVASRPADEMQLAVGGAWVCLVLAGGLTVSNFWDTEPWILLGCLLALAEQKRVPSVNNEGACRLGGGVPCTTRVPRRWT